jgi:hypothetical protein
MSEITTVGLDLAKRGVSLCGEDASGWVVAQRSLRREAVLAWFVQRPSCVVGMEACASAHWSAGSSSRSVTPRASWPRSSCVHSACRGRAMPTMRRRSARPRDSRNCDSWRCRASRSRARRGEAAGTLVQGARSALQAALRAAPVNACISGKVHTEVRRHEDVSIVEPDAGPRTNYENRGETIQWHPIHELLGKHPNIRRSIQRRTAHLGT